jgi:hypothetical protein
VHALALRAEQAQHFDGRWPGGAKPVRYPGVELGHLALGQHHVVLGKHDPEPAVQHVQPFVPLVTARVRHPPAAAGRNDQLVGLQANRPAAERVVGHPVPPEGTRPDPGVGHRRNDDLVQADLVGAREREQQFQRRPALARLQPGQRADRDARHGGYLGQARPAVAAQRPQPRPDRGERLVCFLGHLPTLP